MHDAIRHNSTLSPAQAQVIAALAAGESITGAARAAGVHRSTIHNWLREGQQFRFEFDTIRQETVEFLRDQLAGLEVAALAALKSLIEDANTPAGVRLKAALAVLQRPQFPNQTWSLPERVETPRDEKLVDEFAVAMADARMSQKNPLAMPLTIPRETHGTVTSVARNAPCPCGSGDKYKRCCGKNAPPHIDPGIRAAA
jgi:transposase-like protein